MRSLRDGVQRSGCEKIVAFTDGSALWEIECVKAVGRIRTGGEMCLFLRGVNEKIGRVEADVPKRRSLARVLAKPIRTTWMAPFVNCVRE